MDLYRIMINWFSGMVRSDYAPFYFKRPASFSVNWNLAILHEKIK